MLSNDELTDGINFILKLPDTTGSSVYWMKRLQGDVARHWFDIYRQSDWKALRAEAAGVFLGPVTTADVESAVRLQRCVVIQPHSLSSADLLPGHLIH